MFGMDNKLSLAALLCLLFAVANCWLLIRLAAVRRQRDAAGVTIALLQKEMALLQDQALHDHLTGLPNRALLEDRIRQALVKATREETNFLILFLDLDRFKPVNDMYGHDVGDRLLIDVGRRIRQAVREEDTVARIGGDEFVVLAFISSPPDAALMVRKIGDVLNHPFEAGGNAIHIAASIGQSVFPQDGRSLEELLWKADGAMYLHKKRTHKNNGVVSI